MKKALPIFIITVLSILISRDMAAQDIHFSQFYHTPVLLSPALAGITKADINVGGIYRSQWEAANAPFKTTFLSGENRFYRVTHPKWWFSAGASFFHDQSGYSNLTNVQVAFAGSYTRMLDPENFLSFGASAGFGQRNFDYGNLTFDNQWNGEVFEPSRPTNENFDDTNFLYPDFGAGINWRGQKMNTRSKIDVGAGFYHFNRPNQNFYGQDKSPLPMRTSFYFNPNIQLSNSVDIVGFGTVQLQGRYLEALAGIAGRYYLSTQKSREIALQFGAEYRFNNIGDAVIPVAEIHFHQGIVGFSWDINVSGFATATNRNGGPEIAVRYFIFRVYPLKAYACPLI